MWAIEQILSAQWLSVSETVPERVFRGGYTTGWPLRTFFAHRT